MNILKQIIPQTPRQAFLLGFVLCTVAGLFIILVLAPLTGISRDFGKGHDGYLELARNLSHGNGYVFEEDGSAVFHRPPLYTFFLVPITLLPEFLQRPGLVVVQSILVGFIACLIFKVSRCVFNVPTAKASVLIFLLNPWVYWNAKNPMTPILQGLLYLIFAILVGSELLAMFGTENKVKLFYRRSALGVTAAGLALTHGTMAAVNAALLLVLFFAAILKRNRQAVLTSLLAGLIAAVLIAPWTYRNRVMFERFMPIAGGGGLAYFNGNVHWKNTIEEPQRKGESYIDASLRVCGIDGTQATHTHWMGLKDIELEDKINQKMVENMRAHPFIFGKKVILNAIEYYFPMLTYHFLAVKSFSLQKLGITIFHIVLWGFALVGIYRDRKDKAFKTGTTLILAAIGLYAIWFFPFATFIGHSLYSFGTIPFVSILAAKGLRVSRIALFA